MLKPRTKVPDLHLNLINDTEWSLSEQSPENFTILFFYRGLHCPICKKQLEDITSNLENLSDRGTHVIAISMDTEERAKKTADKWDIPSLPIGFELTEQTARDWGLFISSSIKDEEPETFSEPGMFIIRPDMTLYGSNIQSMPFTRPKTEDLIKSLDVILDKDYPPRGTK